MSFLKPLTAAPKPRKLAAFDTEGFGGPDGFICGSLVCEAGTYRFTDRAAMLEVLLSREFRGHWLVAHNLEYDLGVLTGGDLSFLSCVFVGSRLLWAETQDQDRHKWRFVDSTNILPGSTIEALGKMVDLPKMDLPPGLMSQLKPGDKLSDLPDAIARQLQAYNVRDSEILYKALTQFQDELNSLGGQLQSTIAGCSMDLFRRSYQALPFPTLDGNLSQVVRPSYYGARTEPFILGRAAGVSAFDVNSLYPYIQSTTQFPHPGDLVFEDNIRRHSYILDHEGVAACEVEQPSRAVPVLPYRTGGKLFFPCGKWEGLFTHLELRYALSQGVRINKIHWSIWSRASFNPFTAFIEDLYKARKLAAQDSDIKQYTYKMLMNSHYGRFGVNWETGIDTLEPIPPGPPFSGLYGHEFRLIEGVPYILRNHRSESPPAYANVMFAAYVTAGARVHLHQLLEGNQSGLVYTDTDCLFTTADLPTGPGLGELKRQYDNIDLWVVAPKEYAVFSGDELIESHAKGIPNALHLDYLAGKSVKFSGPVGVKEAYTRGKTMASWVDRLRQRRQSLPKRAPDQLQSVSSDQVLTRPWGLQELDQAVERFRRLGSE